jgi:hypothetical protein
MDLADTRIAAAIEACRHRHGPTVADQAGHAWWRRRTIRQSYPSRSWWAWPPELLDAEPWNGGGILAA